MYLKDLKKEYNIIDIRDSYSYNLGHVYNAVNIPMDILLNNPSNFLNKNDIYYIYCTSGIRSKKTCELLKLLGYKVINVIDGYGK
ncbi:MAG: rhodanese-like domain-containing protein [Bacilli bacterium]|nr:rhodanese-like domain-containing protein [Bacilli bacterium]